MHVDVAVLAGGHPGTGDDALQSPEAAPGGSPALDPRHAGGERKRPGGATVREAPRAVRP